MAALVGAAAQSKTVLASVSLECDDTETKWSNKKFLRSAPSTSTV